MDWTGRRYYTAVFAPKSQEYRVNIIKSIGQGVRIHFSSNVLKQPDEVEDRGYYQCVIGCNDCQADAVEYELRKAQRNDNYCAWQEIKQDLSKKYFDVYGNIMPYRRCDLNPHKRCNHCGDC